MKSFIPDKSDMLLFDMSNVLIVEILTVATPPSRTSSRPKLIRYCSKFTSGILVC